MEFEKELHQRKTQQEIIEATASTDSISTEVKEVGSVTIKQKQEL